jgi:hypothetical protein
MSPIDINIHCLILAFRSFTVQRKNPSSNFTPTKFQFPVTTGVFSDGMGRRAYPRRCAP